MPQRRTLPSTSKRWRLACDGCAGGDAGKAGGGQGGVIVVCAVHLPRPARAARAVGKNFSFLIGKSVNATSLKLT